MNPLQYVHPPPLYLYNARQGIRTHPHQIKDGSWLASSVFQHIETLSHTKHQNH